MSLFCPLAVVSYSLALHVFAPPRPSLCPVLSLVVSRVCLLRFRVYRLVSSHLIYLAQSLSPAVPEGDLRVLRHDKSVLHPLRKLDHLKHIPDYLMPRGLQTGEDPTQVTDRLS